MDRRLKFDFEQNKCIGCKTCQIACKDRNGLHAGELWRKVSEFTSHKYKEYNEKKERKNLQVDVYWISKSCHHCKEPACKSVCRFGAITKTEEGIVLIDSEKCTGCRECEKGCPYEVLQYRSNKNKMSKCNFCYDLIQQGEEPACVAACPMYALDYHGAKKID